MAAGDIHILQDVQTIQGVNGSNVFYIQTVDDSAVTGDLLQNILDAWESEAVPIIAGFQTVGLSHVQLTVRRLQPNTSPLRVKSISVQGANLVDSLPMNNTAKIRTYTNSTTPQQSGRWFFSGIPEDQTSNGRVTLSFLQNMDNFVAFALATFTFANGIYQLVHRYGSNPVVYETISHASCWPVIAKLRGRTPTLSLTG